MCGAWRVCVCGVCGVCVICVVYDECVCVYVHGSGHGSLYDNAVKFIYD